MDSGLAALLVRLTKPEDTGEEINKGGRNDDGGFSMQIETGRNP